MATINRNIARGLNAMGGFHALIFGYTGPASYATGGDAIAAGDLKLGKIEHISTMVLQNATPVALLAVYNHTTGKLLIYYVDNNAASDSGLIEVPNATDLSGYTGRGMAYGTA
jgi:hypothetical protein